MKKNYFMLAAAALMFAACAETDFVNPVPVNEGEVIGFETFANLPTKAEITNETALQGVGFQVWGYKATTASPMDWSDQFTVFNNNTVSYSSGWTSEVARYWDRTSTYKFYAAAPSEQKSYYSIDPATGMISITGAESAKSGASKDYLIDREGETNIVGATASTVGFNFHHIMSKLSFKLKAGIAKDITVTRLVMTGWNSGNGTFVQTLTATPGTADHTSEWTIAAAGEGSVTLVGTGAYDETIVLPADKSVKNVTDAYIMVPQEIAASTLTFTIDYKINETGEVFTAQVGKLSAEQIWGTDAHTTYTITVGPDEIKFNVSSVCGWDAGTPGPGLDI